MTISLLPKLAGEVRRYGHDWSAFLGDDTIASQSNTITGATLDSATIDTGNQSVVFTISGGTAGTAARLTHTITTAAGDHETEVFRIPIGAEEPVTLREAKAQVRMANDDSEDEFLEGLISPARAYVERVSRYSFVAGSKTATFTRWGDFLEIYRHGSVRLMVSPIQRQPTLWMMQTIPASLRTSASLSASVLQSTIRSPRSLLAEQSRCRSRPELWTRAARNISSASVRCSCLSGIGSKTGKRSYSAPFRLTSISPSANCSTS
jgi:hypothetical protein